MIVAPLLDIVDLSIAYAAANGPVRALRDVTLRVERGEVLGLVGESGSGKSTLANAMMALLPANAEIAGRLEFNGADLFGLDHEARRRLRGNGLAAIFQDPFTALNPTTRIGRQLVEFQHHKTGVSRAERSRRAVAMLGRVGISDPERRMRQYPFELSGGIRQRVLIAAALLTEPQLLIADEPTTALDATTERQIIELLRASRALVDGAIVLVTHDMALIADLCDRVAVMYAGELVEAGPTKTVVTHPRHPYTRALLACDPALIAGPTRRFPTIPGQVPDPASPRHGCAFAARCSEADGICLAIAPPMVRGDGSAFARCHRLVA
jgi:peptide/nickel transport system ATP-binding protein